MPIEYSCFISYPHGQDNVLQPLMKEFLEGLRAEVYASTRKKIWIDFECLEPGDRWNDRLARDLCKSVCMIVVYTPLYFDPENAFCAREYRAMEMLEEKRLRMLLASSDRTHGLIIPIVVRGEKRLPLALRSHQYYKFDDIDLADPQVKVRQRYAREIKKISEYIIDRCFDFDRISDPCVECDNFILPNRDETKAYIESVLNIGTTLDPRTTASSEQVDPFPGRAKS